MERVETHGRKAAWFAALGPAWLAALAPAQSPGDAPSGRMPTASVPAAVSGGASVNAPVQLPRVSGTNVINYAPQIEYVWTPGGLVPYAPPLLVVALGGGFPPPMPMPAPVPPPFLAAPAPVAGPAVPARAPRPPLPGIVADRARDPERAEQLAVLGDRHFRAGDLKRAVTRYEQALRANPADPRLRVRLSQVALVRGDHAEAVDRLREAQAADPGWLDRPFDVQTLFPEPARFAEVVTRLESRVQTRPDDRDAWLVLGAVQFLSGRTAPAADIFLRLSDRKPDALLASFLAATRQDEAADVRD